jgi:hypothetical protein
MGTDASPNVFGDDDEEEHGGYKTGTSTPGYRQEGGKLLVFILPAHTILLLLISTNIYDMYLP